VTYQRRSRLPNEWPSWEEEKGSSCQMHARRLNYQRDRSPN
jgi:hypothetical protein